MWEDGELCVFWCLREARREDMSIHLDCARTQFIYCASRFIDLIKVDSIVDNLSYISFQTSILICTLYLFLLYLFSTLLLAVYQQLQLSLSQLRISWCLVHLLTHRVLHHIS